MSASKNLIFLLSGLLLNCQEAVESTPPAGNKTESKGYFISATPGEETGRTMLQLLATGFGQSQLSALLKYDVTTYTLNYHTTFKGRPMEASGLIMVPKGMIEEAPLVSLQHGTTFEKADAPSVRGGFQGLEFFASAGYITLMPDFLGYGKSDSIFHPYYDREHSASTVTDMLQAAKEFLNREKVLFSRKLFLAGYSEGGYVTLAAAKEIESRPIDGLQLTAVAAGAGGYDLPEMLHSITSGGHYAYPSYLAFVLMSYNNTYGWNKPLTYFFRNKYAEALTKTMNGTYSGWYINSKLTSHVPSLFNPDFFQSLQTPSGEPELKKALEDNSVTGWKTDVPIRLFHGTKDEIIPFENSEVTLDKFKAAGSTNVTLTLIPGGTHGNSFERMLRDFIPWFLSFKEK
jgi:alpha-beta hydrolase superfamily lysophospholipase